MAPDAAFRYHRRMRLDQQNRRRQAVLLACVVLPGLSALFLWLEHRTHVEFLLHLAAIPIEILIGGVIVERWMAGREKEGKRQQLMYFKSYLFRSDMRMVFISNFSALVKPAITLEWIRGASLAELRAAHDGITELEYSSPAAKEEVLGEYVRARHVWQTFMEWAATNDFESIFHDMIFLLHFVQDMQAYKAQNPERLFVEAAATHPRLRAKMDKVLRDGVVKFLEYAIELREKEPEVIEELLDDYLLSSKMRA
jgi:hypothetical protein